MTDPTLTPDQTPQPQASPPSSRWRRKLVGPFTVAQILAVILAIAISGVSLAVLTSPITRPTPTAPRPGSSMYVVGSPQPGLRLGDLAPEFSGTTIGGQTVQLADLDGFAMWSLAACAVLLLVPRIAAHFDRRS